MRKGSVCASGSRPPSLARRGPDFIGAIAFRNPATHSTRPGRAQSSDVVRSGLNDPSEVPAPQCGDFVSERRGPGGGRRAGGGGAMGRVPTATADPTGHARMLRRDHRLEGRKGRRDCSLLSSLVSTLVLSKTFQVSDAASCRDTAKSNPVASNSPLTCPAYPERQIQT